MIVEVIAVGTELLIGQIINSNGARIGQRLAEEGFDAHHQVIVGDNLERLSDAITTALTRADAVIMTGGVGPTQDDLTREAICHATGRGMVRDETHAQHIRERILARRGAVNDRVLRMADHPTGSEALPNTQGVALGVALEQNRKWIFAVPGVPREMTAMVDLEVIPRLRAHAGVSSVIRSRVLRTWGFGESQISELLDDLYASINPSIAFLISDMEVRVRITAKAGTPEAAGALILPMEREVTQRLGDKVFATDDETIHDVLESTLGERGWSVAVHEHGTDGLVTSQLSSLGVFAGGATVRSLDGSEILAERALEMFGSQVGLGIGAPEVVDDAADMATEMSFTVITPERSETQIMRFFGTGERARAHAVNAALHRLRIAVG